MTIRGQTMRPSAFNEAKAKELIENALAAWAIPFPPTLHDSNFMDRLAKTGSYVHVEADVSIIAKRSA